LQDLVELLIELVEPLLEVAARLSHGRTNAAGRWTARAGAAGAHWKTAAGRRTAGTTTRGKAAGTGRTTSRGLANAARASAGTPGAEALELLQAVDHLLQLVHALLQFLLALEDLLLQLLDFLTAIGLGFLLVRALGPRRVRLGGGRAGQQDHACRAEQADGQQTSLCLVSNHSVVSCYES
jgi:hypothetical protein